MKKAFVSLAALASLLQSSVALAADAAVCQELGSGQYSFAANPANFTLHALLLTDDNISLNVYPVNGSCFGLNMGFKSTRGAISIVYNTMGVCGTNSIPSQLWLNYTQGGSTRLYPGLAQADGSTLYIGRVFVTSPTPVAAYDFKIVYKNSNFIVGCTAKVDASGVSTLWNGR